MKTQTTYQQFVSFRKSIVLLFSLMMTSALFAQTGTLSGTVKEENGDPIFQAIVKVMGTNLGGQTGFEGEYTIANIPVGNQKVVFANVFTNNFDTLDVTIQAGANTLDHQFGQNVLVLTGVDIIVKVDKESKEATIGETINSEQAVEVVGAAKLEDQGVSDVGTAATKVAGISKVGSGRVFVRGMGDRYNNAFLNGLPVPSPNPDLKVIPLDIFPTSIVQTIAISKVFNEKYYADYAGASIDINTKTYTDTIGFFKIGLSGTYNTVSTFKDFYTHKDGAVELLGIDGGNRDLPVTGTDVNSDLRPLGDLGYNTKDNFESTTIPYNTGLTPTLQKALPNMGISLSAGKFFAFKDSSGYKSTSKGIGVMLSLSTSNQYSSVFDGLSRQYSAQSSILTNFRYNKFSYKTSSSAIGSVIYKINSNNNISYNLLYVADGDNETRENEGYSQDLDRNVYSRRNSFIINSLLNQQLLGQHELEKMDVNWGLSYGMAGSEEKDRKQLAYYADPEGYVLNDLDIAGSHRLWSALTEDEIAGKAVVDYHFYGKDSTGKKAIEKNNIIGNLTIGLNARHKERIFDYKQVNYEFSNVEVLQGGDYADVYDPDSYINSAAADAGNLVLGEPKDPGSYYEATLDIASLYAGVDYDLTDKFKVLGGLRLEASQQTIYYKQLKNTFASDPDTVTIDTINVFPSIGFKYSPAEKTNIRFALSQTITRPGFKEVAPFLNQSYFGGPTSLGNPELENAYNYNADLKFERSPRSGELMSFTIFGRYLDNPIERIAEASSSTLLTYENIDQAVLAGVEFEITKSLASILNPKMDQDALDSLQSWTKNVSGGANFSYMYSQTIIPDNGNFVVTNNKRQLQGASPYLINFDAGYNWEFGKDTTGTAKHSIKFTVAYNVFGPRIFAAGVQGAEDIFERPVNTLDFIVKAKFNDRLSIGIKAKNLLNPEIKMEQAQSSLSDLESSDALLVNSYRRGISIGLSLGYKF
ncbi:MAG: TonB-dependent receptor plug domain-containing protein [Cytophagales bacterium]|nr:TonB-dependent receptor plug domain-containing protein [Cytophagales bacterium]